jgi:hypothetical protein
LCASFLAPQRLVASDGGILFSEALAAEGAIVFAKACDLGLEGIVSKREGSFYRCARSQQLAQDQEPEFRQDVTGYMIKIAVTAEAFAAIEATLPLGTVGVEPKPNEKGEREIWLDDGALNRLRLMRGPDESYSDAILRLAARETH